MLLLAGYLVSYLGAAIGIAAGVFAGIVLLVVVGTMEPGPSHAEKALAAGFYGAVIVGTIASAIAVALLLRLGRLGAVISSGIAVGISLVGLQMIHMATAIRGMHVLGPWVALGLAPAVGRTVGLGISALRELLPWKRVSPPR